VNADGQVYFDRDEEIPDEDKQRLADAEEAYIAEQLVKERMAEMQRMLDEGGSDGE
jgi:hypothetical protein